MTAITPAWRRAMVACAVLAGAALAGCAKTPAAPTTPAASTSAPALVTDRTLPAELAALARAHPGRLAVERYGTSSEGRELLVARIGTRGPATLVIFGLHPDEYDMPLLALRVVRKALVDPALADRRLYVVPLANPDGTAYALASNAPFAWRKNRRGPGANLNRNWGGHWQRGTAEPSAPEYPGDAAFSEPETRALRDFVVGHPEIAGFVDAHSGASSFNQGFVLYPYSDAETDTLPPAWRVRHRAIAEEVARAMTCEGDPRPAFVAVQSREVRQRVLAYMEETVPAEHRAAAMAQVPASTAAAGASIDWAFDTLGKPALGLEIARPFEAATPADFAAASGQHLERCGDAYYRAIAGFATASW